MSTQKNPRRLSIVSKPIFYALIVSYLTAAILAGVSIQYANYVDTESNQRWCDLLIVLDTTYQQSPPKTQTGIHVAQEINKLRSEFRC